MKYLTALIGIALIGTAMGIDIPVQENGDPTPIVLWHGMGDSCCNPMSMGSIKRMLEKELPGVYVKSLMIGDNVFSDTTNGFFKNANDQIDMVCDQLSKDEKLADGFNAIGFSQGGQFLRAYVERCNKPRVKNLLSVGGQHQGVYGFPRCPGSNSTLCDMARKLLNLGAYNSFVQHHLVQAQYWKDPLNLDAYLKKNTFMVDINNEGPEKNEQYKENLMSLDNFVMVKFTEDGMVQPRESEWFGFYTPGQAKEIQKVQDTDIYQNDWLGLKQMDQDGKLTFLACPGDHLQMPAGWFEDNLMPFLKN